MDQQLLKCRDLGVRLWTSSQVPQISTLWLLSAVICVLWSFEDMHMHERISDTIFAMHAAAALSACRLFAWQARQNCLTSVSNSLRTSYQHKAGVLQV